MLIDLLPTNFVLWLAAPYLAGWNSQEALDKVKVVWKQNNFATTLDVLGEDSNSSEQCEYYVRIFTDLIDQVKKDPLPTADLRYQPTISFKPSMFCVVKSHESLPEQCYLDEAFLRITRVVDHAKKCGLQMTLEAESHLWTDFHLNSYFALLEAGYTNLGTVLQSRLFRTEIDIKRFGENTRVRLVTGIYKENAEIAHVSNKPMKETLIRFSSELLNKGAYVELASHDQIYIHKFFTDVILPLNISPKQFEIQFLLGVPRLHLQQSLSNGSYFKNWDRNNRSATEEAQLEILAQEGVLVRLYLPFGSSEVASPYCKRRLQHNPNLFVYGIKNILHLK